MIIKRKIWRIEVAEMRKHGILGVELAETTDSEISDTTPVEMRNHKIQNDMIYP